nr:Uncharacterised protein [Raoultella sp. NCTC 9187]
MQANDDLNPVAAPHHSVAPSALKTSSLWRFRHIDQRDAQPGGAVIDVLDIASPAERLQEACGLAQSGAVAPAALVLPRAAW